MPKRLSESAGWSSSMPIYPEWVMSLSVAIRHLGQYGWDSSYGSTLYWQGIFPAMWLRDSTAQLPTPIHVDKRDPLASDHCRLGQASDDLGAQGSLCQLLLTLRRTEAVTMRLNFIPHPPSRFGRRGNCFAILAAGLILERDWRNQSVWWNFCHSKSRGNSLHLWTVEQDHVNSPYRFVRDGDRKATLW